MKAARALIADAGGLLRALARRPGGEAAWPEFEAALTDAARVVVPSAILPEIDYFLREDRSAMRRFVAELFDPKTTYVHEAVTPADVVRALHLDAKFAALGLGLVDGAVAAVAERLAIHRVLTTDRRDFGALRIGPRLETSLEIVP